MSHRDKFYGKKKYHLFNRRIAYYLCRSKDLAEPILAVKMQGLRATISFAQGTGIQDGVAWGNYRRTKLEVIRIVVSQEQSELVFETMYLAGKLDDPGKGIMFMSSLDRVATAYLNKSLKVGLKK